MTHHGPPPPPILNVAFDGFSRLARSGSHVVASAVGSPTALRSGRHRSLLNKRPELLLLSFALFLAFGLHNYLQERIMAIPGWRWGSMLGLLEAAGLAFCTALERALRSDTVPRRAPWRAFVTIAAVVALSAMLSNSALDYINYPVKVIFRSAKVIPTMLAGGLLFRRSYSRGEYGAALVLTAGLLAFGFADFSVSPRWSPFGLLLVMLSVCADAFTPNLQEALFARHGSSRSELVLYSNVLSVAYMVCVTWVKGDLGAAVTFLGTAAASERALVAVYMVAAYFAISTWVQIIKRFDGVVAVIVASARKGMTLLLSFLLFPKPWSPWYAVGGVLVLAGVVWTAAARSSKKKTLPQ